MAALLIDLLDLLTALGAVDGIASCLAEHRLVDCVVTNDALQVVRRLSILTNTLMDYLALLRVCDSRIGCHLEVIVSFFSS